MVHKYQEQDDYDNYDPVPYQGGYDQAAAYGSVKPADEESGYRRADFGEDEDEQEVQYGNESNPYGHGPPGASIVGGHPTPGGVYGGGRDRTRPDPDQAQPDEGVETGYGNRRNQYEDQPSYGEEEDQGYRKPKPSYGEEESGYNNEEESEYRKPKPSYGEEEEGYRKPSYGEEEEGYRKPSYGEEEEGYRKPSYGEEEGYRKPSYGEEEEGYRKPRPAYGEEESEESGYRQPRPEYGEEEGGYGGRRKQYGEEDTEEGGYGGYRSRRNEDEEPAEEEKKAWW